MNLVTLRAVCPLLEEFDDGDLSGLQEASLAHEFPPGHLLLSNGDANDCLYIIAAGAVDVRRYMGNRDVELAQLHVGDSFGEISMLTGRPCTADLTAAGAASILEVRRSRLDDLLAARPGLGARFWRNLTRALATRLADTNDLLATHLSINDAWLEESDFLQRMRPD